MKSIPLCVLLLFAAALPASAQSRRLEITQVDLEATVVEELAVVRLSVTMRNWNTGARQADMTFLLPHGAVLLDLDSVGPLEADVETVLQSIEARRQILKLVSIARRLNKEDRGHGGRRGTFPSPRIVKKELFEMALADYTPPPPPPSRRMGPRRLTFTTAARRKRDPQLLEKVGYRGYRLRMYPMSSARAFVMRSPEGVFEISRTPGHEQRADLIFVQRLSVRPESGTPLEWRTLNLPLTIMGSHGRRLKVPPASVRILLSPCERFFSVRAAGRGLKIGTVDDRPAVDTTYALSDGTGAAPLRVAMRVGPASVATGGGAAAPHDARCNHSGGYDMRWIRSCLAASDRINRLARRARLKPEQVDEIMDLGRRHKLVTRWTSILRADSSLYEAWGKPIPPSAPDRVRLKSSDKPVSQP